MLRNARELRYRRISCASQAALQIGVKRLCALALCAVPLCVGGCGEHVASSGNSQAGTCGSAPVIGSVQDSLTNQAIQGARVFLEAASQNISGRVLSFAVEQHATTLPDGSFQLCSLKTQGAQAIVIAAQDIAGRAYPPLVIPVLSAVNLGAVAMGGCRVTCGFEGQQQSSAPATITGSITTAPGADAGVVAPRYALAAPDGSGDLWNLEIPALNSEQLVTFQTTDDGCAAQRSICSPYTFVLPSQKPVVIEKGEYLQQTGPPTYAVLATVTDGRTCVPASGSTNFQQGGLSPLTGIPGGSLSAAAIYLQDCY